MASGIGAVAAVIAATAATGPAWWALLPGIGVGGLGMGLVVAPLTEIALLAGAGVAVLAAVTTLALPRRSAAHDTASAKVP